MENFAKTYRWTEDADGLVITKYKGLDVDVEIPEQIDGKPVVKIGKNAFKGDTQVQSIRMPDSITEILESAFEKCSALVNVRWSDNLRTIEKRAFYFCRGLSGTLSLPQSIKSIGMSAFSGCPFSEYELPDGLELIADSALDCGNCSQLHIPASVRDMGSCTGYFPGDLYIHGIDTKLKSSFYRGMPLTVHAPAGSYAAKCAKDGTFKEFLEM